MKYDAIVLAYGKGTRLNLGFNKVLYKLDDETILDKALKPFIEDEDCLNIILVISEEDRKEIKENPKFKYTLGGKERFNSVYNGLNLVDNEYVMIHDGARPDITLADLNNIKEALEDDDDAVIVGSFAKDTIKEVKDSYICKTINRDNVFIAKTPQAFKTNIIKEAYDKLINSSIKVTDDAEVIELFFNTKIKVINSINENNKITFKKDLGI